jgi:hypothetical protein
VAKIKSDLITIGPLLDLEVVTLPQGAEDQGGSDHGQSNH